MQNLLTFSLESLETLNCLFLKPLALFIKPLPLALLVEDLFLLLNNTELLPSILISLLDSSIKLENKFSILIALESAR